MRIINHEAGKHLVEAICKFEDEKLQHFCNQGVLGMTTALEFADTNYERDGIVENIETWYEGKIGLGQLLSRSPDWNKDILAVVKEVEYNVQVSRREKKDAFGRLVTYVYSSTRNYDDLDVKNNALLLSAFSDDTISWSGTNMFLKERIETAEEVDFFEQVLDYPRVSIGMKYSRLMQKMLKQWDDDLFSGEVVEKYNDWVDKISEKKQKYLWVASVNPADYLLMSYGNSWTSCHIINPGLPLRGDGYSGGYRSGTLSYMGDDTSIVTYIVPVGTPVEDIPFTPKINRQMVFLGKETPSYFASRMYPANNESPFYDLFEGSTRKLLDECHSTGNGKWKEVEVKVYTAGGTHYSDYSHFRSSCRWAQYVVDGESPHRDIQLGAGHDVRCLVCGVTFDSSGTMFCGECNDELTCDSCGCVICDDEDYCIGDDVLCEGCWENDTSWCNSCDNRHYNNDLTYTDDGHYVCPTCLESDYYPCEACGGYVHSENVYTTDDGTPYCQSCYDDRYTHCDHCDCEIDLNDAMELGCETVCPDCYAEATAECEECGETVPSDEAKEYDGRTLCQDCYEEATEAEEEKAPALA